jgi:pyrroloquinoline-quinone synthase
MKRTEWIEQLDFAIAERNLLKHPFYQDWQAGTLDHARLQLYAAQYYLLVEAFPAHLEDLAERSEGDLRVVILENLADEEDAAAPHPKLWCDFAAAVGVGEQTLWTIAPLPGIRRLLGIYREICQEGSLAEAVAALYAYEAQVPEVAMAKIDGLRRHYGVNTPQGLAYFRVHQTVDKIHRAAWRRWLEHCGNTSAGNESKVDEEQILRTARKALDALWGALDSIQEAPCQAFTSNLRYQLITNPHGQEFDVC